MVAVPFVVVPSLAEEQALELEHGFPAVHPQIAAVVSAGLVNGRQERFPGLDEQRRDAAIAYDRLEYRGESNLGQRRPWVGTRFEHCRARAGDATRAQSCSLQ